MSSPASAPAQPPADEAADDATVPAAAASPAQTNGVGVGVARGLVYSGALLQTGVVPPPVASLSSPLPLRLAAVEHESTTDDEEDEVQQQKEAAAEEIVHAMLASLKKQATMKQEVHSLLAADSADALSDELDHAHQLGNKRSPIDTQEEAGKGASEKGVAAALPNPAIRTRQIAAVLAGLSQTTKRAAPFTMKHEAALAASCKEAAFDRILAASAPSAVPSADLDVVARTANGVISEKDIAHYLTTVPLLYAESDPISPPHTNFVLHARAPEARQVFEQTVQALFLHSAQADFVRRPKAAIAGKPAAGDKKKAPPVVSSDSESDGDDEGTELISLSLDSGPSAPSPIDPNHPELKKLLLTLEEAFDMPDKITKRASEPFRSTVGETLTLAQSLLRLHQSRLDDHPLYRRSSFPSAAHFNVYYSQENAHLNDRMNQVSESLAYEKVHTRKAEQERKKQLAAAEADRLREKYADPGAKAAGAQVKKKKSGGFFSCCSTAVDEPDAPAPDARMESRPIAAAGSSSKHLVPVDDSAITKWSGDLADFHASYTRLVHVLAQYEFSLEWEIERDEAEERRAKAQEKLSRLTSIDFAQLKHPDELEEIALAEKKAPTAATVAAAETADDQPDDESLEKARTVPIYTTRTLNARRMCALGESSRRILAIFAEVWRVGLPFTLGKHLSLYDHNLNFNQPEWYSCMTNTLAKQSVLYKAHLRFDSAQSGYVTPTSKKGKLPTVPFTNLEVQEYKRVVKEAWEWIVLSLQRYQLVFARTAEMKQREEESGIRGGIGGVGPGEDPSSLQDGLRECLYLFAQVYKRMRDLDLHIATHCSRHNDAVSATASSSSGSEPPLSMVARCKCVIEVAVTNHYDTLVEAAATGESNICSAPSPTTAAVAAAAAASSGAPFSDLGPEVKIKSAKHLLRLIKLVTQEVILDSARATVFREVLSETDISDDVTRSLADNPGPSGFNLPLVSHTLYYSSLWSDAHIFLSSLSTRHAELTKQYQSSRKSRIYKEINELEASVEPVLAVYVAMRDFYSLVSRSLPALPPLEVTGWFEPFVRLWIARVRAEWVTPLAGGGLPLKMSELISRDDFRPQVLGVPEEEQKRYSTSLVELFTQIRILSKTFLDLPVPQAEIENFANAIALMVSAYVRELEFQLIAVLERESKKKPTFGLSMGAAGEMELTLQPEVFARINDIHLCRGQVAYLLDELHLKRLWLSFLPAHAGPTNGNGDASTQPAAAAATTTDAGARSPISIHSATSPVFSAPELPSEREKNATAGDLARSPATSPYGSVSPFPSPSPDGDIPPAVLNVLDCRSAFSDQANALEDVLAGIVGGLGVFLESQVLSIIAREVEDEWTGRHTSEALEPMFAYLRQHFDHMRVWTLDEVFSKFMHLLLADFALILEKALVHPRRALYKYRLSTPQIHRVIQIHYVVSDFIEHEYNMPAEYMSRLKETHLNRLEYLEMLLTGGSEGLIDEFNKLDEGIDEANHKQSFAVRENYRLSTAPYLSRRQIAGVIAYRAEIELDHSAAVTAFVKAHRAGLWSSNFFQ